MFTMPLRVTLVALACAFLLALAAPFATADSGGKGGGNGHDGPPGDNGTVKVHRSSTPADDPRNEPHVCEFYLAAFGFDAGQQVAWKIRGWAPTGDRDVVSSGTLTVGENGRARTEDMTLDDGHYKLFWRFAGEHGKAKHKVFWVKCMDETKSPSPTDKPSETPTETPTETPSETPTSPSPSATEHPAAPVPSAVHTRLPVTG